MLIKNIMSCKEIRQHFIEFFAVQDFQRLPSAPMLHSSIPMSFVMSAGLVQVETVLTQLNLKQGESFTLIQNCFRYFDDAIGITI
jgi:alanyl-tRNA synthetase